MSPERLEEIKKMMGITNEHKCIKVEGYGYAFIDGELNVEKYVRRLLKCKYVTG